ncbi:uncharacterized protein [Typha latifolia]|uniref:uncharacterized protein n=1 Tax=Typha latifolia TaxID=4733 RepID=UPI003C2E640B
MEEGGKNSRPSLKRSLPISDDESEPPPEKRRPRFPKGKKVKDDGGVAAAALPNDGDVEDLDGLIDPQLAAKERAKRRKGSARAQDEHQIDVAAAEVHYEDDTNFVEDGIRIEPFNLEQEREEGYFDANGNFVEYASQKKIKDAWLDSVEVDTRFAGKVQEKANTEVDYHDLSSDDIGKIKRNIANILQPGETIIQALKRLKGTSTDKRGKMSEVTKHIFDQLTEDAMKLMENGDYNVYHEERETFEREAEGYERLLRAREGASDNSSIWDMGPGPSAASISTLQLQSNEGDEKFDMFGEDDDNADVNLRSDTNATALAFTSGQVSQSTSGNIGLPQNLESGESTDGGLGSDYVYDTSSGYYYSSSLGYYYDPGSGFYCCASTGTWYSFDEQTGAYNEVQGVASSES